MRVLFVRSILFIIVLLSVSDADVCEEWVPGSRYAGDGMCYRLNRVHYNFTQAQSFCHNNYGGRLAEPRSMYQFQTAKDLLIDGSVKHAFLGASDHKGDWEWLTGSYVQVDSDWWGIDQPDNSVPLKNCLILNAGLLWDELCSATFGSICQKHLGNPCRDHLQGAEYYDGQCFLAVPDSFTLEQAQGFCESRGAYLAELNTAELIAFVNMFAWMNFDLNQNVVIGLTLTLPDDHFRWLSTGYRVTEPNWFPGPFGDPFFGNTGSLGIITTLVAQERVTVVMVQTLNWKWIKVNTSTEAFVICQKVIPVYRHTYLAALSDSAHSATESILLSASHAHSLPGWITVELTYKHIPDAEVENFLGQKGFQLRFNITQPTQKSLMMRSTEPLFVTFTLWRHDLSAISSSLLLPVVTSDVPESRLAYPSPGNISLSVVSNGDSTVELELALSGGESGATFSIGDVQYTVWPWVTLDVDLRSESNVLYVESISGYDKTHFVHSHEPTVLLASEIKPSIFFQFTPPDITFENILSTSQVGTSYVTFPSLPLNPNVQDTFTVVAVFDDTMVKVPYSDPNRGTYDVILDEAGDVLDIVLKANGFRHVTGSKPFYLYARLRGLWGGNRCTVTLLSDHLWAEQYTVYMDDPWTRLQYVYVVVVGEGESLEEINVKTADGEMMNLDKDCEEVQGTNYSACYLQLPSSAEAYHLSRPQGNKFAAYMFGTKGLAAACHQLGMDFTAAPAGDQQFDAQVYLESLREDIPEPCSEEQSQSTETTENPSNIPEDTTTEVSLSEETTSTVESSTSSYLDLQSTFVELNASAAPTSPTQLPPCGYNGGPIPNLTSSSKEFQDLLEKTSEFLRVDGVNTSQARRRKESAQDHRVSSVSLGLFSCTIIFIVVSMLSFSDVSSVFSTFLDCMKER